MRKRRPFIKEKRELILKRDGYKCIYCDKKRKLEIDHVVPLKEGGLDTMANLVTSCKTCNTRKNGNRLLPKHEKMILDYVNQANFSHGIPDQDTACSPGGLRTMHGTGREGERDRRRRERVVDSIALAFQTNRSLFIAKTENIHETKKLTSRARKKNTGYLCIPCNQFGGKIFLLNKRDIKSIRTEHDEALDNFILFYDKTEWGYFSGNLAY